MKKILNYISIALLALTLFSCNKNEWTPEKETEFKQALKDTLQSKGKDLFSDDQIVSITDCIFDKIKSKNIKPNDAEKGENLTMAFQMGKECSQEIIAKTNATWNPQSEKTYTAALKRTFTQSGIKSEQASALADCAITKLKEQNISPADLQDPKKAAQIQKIGLDCGKELAKKK